MDKKTKKITHFDKFICTVIKPLYFLALITSVALMLVSINKLSKYFNILWITSLIVFVLLMSSVYIISKKIKTKANKLEIVSVPVIKKIGFIALSIVVVLLITIVLAVITVNNVVG